MPNMPEPTETSAAEALTKQGQPPQSDAFARLERSKRFQRLTEDGLRQIERGESIRLVDLQRELGNV